MFEQAILKAMNDLKGKKIGILMGGYSSEREISLKSGQAVLEALSDAGYDARGFDLKRGTLNTGALRKMDVLFPVLHGKGGEDGAIQGLLEWLNIPYVGSGVQASAFALNKYVTKLLAEKAGIPTAPFALNERGGIPLPLVVKGVNEGSSLGMAICRTEEEFEKAIEALKPLGDLIVEQFIEGRQLTVGFLAGKPLPVIEICPEGGEYDFKHKYTSGLTAYHCPADISEELTESLQQLAVQTADACGCRDLSRVDFMLDANNQPFMLEINTIPGFTATSLLPKGAKVAGVSFTKLVLLLLHHAIERGKKQC